MLFFAVLENVHSELYGVADHALSEANGLPPSERAAKAVLAVCHKEQIGELYPQVLETLVYGACRELFK